MEDCFGCSCSPPFHHTFAIDGDGMHIYEGHSVLESCFFLLLLSHCLTRPVISVPMRFFFSQKKIISIGVVSQSLYCCTTASSRVSVSLPAFEGFAWVIFFSHDFCHSVTWAPSWIEIRQGCMLWLLWAAMRSSNLRFQSVSIDRTDTGIEALRDS
ncbi:hypothetical protein BDZ45DRAFT_458759 [Acephala macrosclerotiorum]|nr:hypothetical protein BDZ45DRAFT_458759 [Acephala macrosclerotiorum]